MKTFHSLNTPKNLPPQTCLKTKPLKGFTLIELIAVVAIIVILLGIIIAFLSSVRKSANLVQATSDMRQLGSAVILFTLENDGNYPVGFPHIAQPGDGLSNMERAGQVWYEALGRIIYPEIRASNDVRPWMREFMPNGFKGTVFWSPSAEPGSNYRISSYAYNDLLYIRAESNRKYSLVFSPSQTVLLADGSGRTHSLNPTVANGQINARHGASAPHAGDGQAVVAYLDGRAEVLSAEQVARYNDDPQATFWGVRE